MKQIFDTSKDPNNGQPEISRIAHPEVIGSRVPVYGYAHSITRMVLEKGYDKLLVRPESSPIPDTPEPVEPEVELTPDNVIQIGGQVVQHGLSELDMIRQQVEEARGFSEAA